MVPRPTARAVPPVKGTTAVCGAACRSKTLTATWVARKPSAATALARCTDCTATRSRGVNTSRSVAASPHVTTAVSESRVKTPAK